MDRQTFVYTFQNNAGVNSIDKYFIKIPDTPILYNNDFSQI